MRKNSNLSLVAYIGFLVVIIGLCAFILFTKQSRVKNFGGEMTYDLDVNQKLIEVTWKDNDLWILTKDMSNNDVAESSVQYMFSLRISQIFCVLFIRILRTWEK